MKLPGRTMAVVTVVASILLVNAVRIFAGAPSDTGPCVRIQQDEIHSSIVCVGGECGGAYLIVHGESACAGQEGGGECHETVGLKYTVIPAMTIPATEVPRTPACTPSRTHPADPCCFVKCVLNMAAMTHAGDGIFCD
jgi:hypothetical protein